MINRSNNLRGPRGPIRGLAPAVRAAVALLLLACAACAAGTDTPAPRHPERLNGRWTIELRLTSPATLTSDTAGMPPVAGDVVLVENRDGTAPRAADGLIPTHYGTYAADLAPYHLGAHRSVPAVAARLSAGDSVYLAFDPGQSGGFRAAGRMDGDSIRGRWLYDTGRTGGSGSGTFVMRRP